jgi:hypothetical protein
MPRPQKERRSEGPRFTRNSGWVARVWEKGVKISSGWLSLGTTDREQARKLLDAWVRTGVRPATKRGERSFSEEAERILDEKSKATTEPSEQKALQYRRDRLRKYALPVLGQVPVGMLEPSHIMGFLDRMASDGAAARTIHNLRSDVSVVLAKLVREGQLKMNPAHGAELPEDAPVDTRERMHLSDEQMVTFQTRRGFGTPLDMNIMLCRCVGGHRTSDGHAGDWSHVDLVNFAWMKVRRPKTDGQVGQRVGQRRSKTKSYEYVVHAVPEEFRPALRQYWESRGKPTSGPIFPLLRDAVSAPMKMKDGRVIERKGGKVGERKGRGTSYAGAFQRAVWQEEIYSPLPGFDPAKPEKKFCAFQTDTKTTRRLTFHGIRADLNAALVEAGVTADQRIAIMGHTQEVTGNKHYMKRILVGVPAEALPGRILPKAGSAWEERGFLPGSGMKPSPAALAKAANSTKSLARPGRFERPTFGSVDEWSPEQGSLTPVNTAATGEPESPSEGVSSQALGGFDSTRAALLAQAAQAVATGDWTLADRIRARLESPPLASVHKLADARRRK